MIFEIKFNSKIFISLSVIFFLVAFFTETGIVRAQDTDSRVEIFLSPRSGSFTEGSTFEVPVFINTNSASIESINIKINFNKDKLAVVKPSGGKSIIGFWNESPSYDNTRGVINYYGTISGGVVTESGLISVITFKALSSGVARVNIDPDSKILLDDGLETKALLDLGRVEYDILKKTSEGVVVFSETHPSENKWYTNNSPVLSWQRESSVTGFSFILDNKPFTIPDNIIDSNETTKSYDNFTDGLWYFHIKSLKNGSWGNTGQFLVKIDTVPPAPFTPQISNFSASAILTGRNLISFFTTDNLSGVDHYEVGTIDESQPITKAPVFIETESPFQVPVLKNSTLKVVVRAFDKAGNIQEGYVEVAPPLLVWNFLNNKILVISFIILIFLSFYLIKLYKKKSSNKTSNFNVIESGIKDYINQKKGLYERNIIERGKIENLEKNLEEIKMEIDKENIENK